METVSLRMRYRQYLLGFSQKYLYLKRYLLNYRGGGCKKLRDNIMNTNVFKSSNTLKRTKMRSNITNPRQSKVYFPLYPGFSQLYFQV